MHDEGYIKILESDEVLDFINSLENENKDKALRHLSDKKEGIIGLASYSENEGYLFHFIVTTKKKGLQAATGRYIPISLLLLQIYKDGSINKEVLEIILKFYNNFM